MIEATKENFKKEISNGTLIVDFWADWCVDPDSTWILTEDNIMQKARNILNKEKLLTYNGRDIVSDQVKRSLTSIKFGHCREIVTETNRKIKVTDEHEFFTQKGWKKAIELKELDKVAIMPVYTRSNESFANGRDIIINEDKIIQVATKTMRIRNYIRELKEKDLLPLRVNNEKIFILTRLLGALFTDGTLYINKKNNYREISFSLGTKKDLEKLIKDLNNLGFDKIHFKKDRKIINVNNRSYTLNIFKIKVCSTSLWLLMKALGVPVGDKTNSSYTLPRWLINTKYDYLKREFLAAYMGGDGPRISMRLSKRTGKQPYNNISINDIEFHKNPKVLKSGIRLAKQLSKLFKELDIEISRTFIENDKYIKKDGKRSKIIHLKFKNNFKNAVSLYQNIGYRYSYTKEINSQYVAEFIRRIINKKQNWLEKYTQAIMLNRDESYGYRKLSRILDLPPHTVYQWIKKGVKPTINRHHEKYPTWLKENTKGLPEGLVWEPVKSISKIYLESVQKITMEKNHNFIANNFLVHNCGPCILMKPHIESLSKELKNIKFIKVDVDSEPEIASQFNVSSIPTLVLMKDRKMRATLIGYKSKEALKAWIKDNS